MRCLTRRRACRQLWAFEMLKTVKYEEQACPLIRNHRMTHEMVPTELKKHAIVWEALLEHMPMTAMIRNLATMTRIGLLKPMSDAVDHVVEALEDESRIRKAGVHPITVLSALKTYASGQGVRGSNTWEPHVRIVDALDKAFYLSFGNVVPTGKRWCLGLDVSGSMFGNMVAGVHGLDAAVASAAMALVTVATEEKHVAVAFTEKGPGRSFKVRSLGSGFWQRRDAVHEVTLSNRERLDDVVKRFKEMSRFMSGTDCALPMLWALEHKVPVDVFAIYTDSETWAGKIHPSDALKHYREQMGIPAKLIVVAMCSNGFSIADPNDSGQLDVVGFNTATPKVMADFVR